MARKKSAHRAVGFRMPLAHYEVVEQIAQSQGVDVSAILNRLVAEAIPELRKELERLRPSTAQTDLLAACKELLAAMFMQQKRETEGRP